MQDLYFFDAMVVHITIETPFRIHDAMTSKQILCGCSEQDVRWIVSCRFPRRHAPRRILPSWMVRYFPLCLAVPSCAQQNLPTKANKSPCKLPDQKPTRTNGDVPFQVMEKARRGGETQDRQAEVGRGGWGASRLFLLLGLGTLDLRGTAESLLSVLALLACIR